MPANRFTLWLSGNCFLSSCRQVCKDVGRGERTIRNGTCSPPLQMQRILQTKQTGWLEGFSFLQMLSTKHTSSSECREDHFTVSPELAVIVLLIWETTCAAVKRRASSRFYTLTGTLKIKKKELIFDFFPPHSVLNNIWLYFSKQTPKFCHRNVRLQIKLKRKNLLKPKIMSMLNKQLDATSSKSTSINSFSKLPTVQYHMDYWLWGQCERFLASEAPGEWGSVVTAYQSQVIATAVQSCDHHLLVNDPNWAGKTHKNKRVVTFSSKQWQTATNKPTPILASSSCCVYHSKTVQFKWTCVWI